MTSLIVRVAVSVVVPQFSNCTITFPGTIGIIAETVLPRRGGRSEIRRGGYRHRYRRCGRIVRGSRRRQVERLRAHQRPRYGKIEERFVGVDLTVKLRNPPIELVDLTLQRSRVRVRLRELGLQRIPQGCERGRVSLRLGQLQLKRRYR